MILKQSKLGWNTTDYLLSLKALFIIKRWNIICLEWNSLISLVSPFEGFFMRSLKPEVVKASYLKGWQQASLK